MLLQFVLLPTKFIAVIAINNLVIAEFENRTVSDYRAGLKEKKLFITIHIIK